MGKSFKTKEIKKRVLSLFLIVFMLIGMMQNSGISIYAADDTISLGAIVYDDYGTASYANVVGTGTTKYFGITLGFGKTAEHGEYITIPSMTGFAKSSKSTTNTTIINMAAGKTLPEIAEFIKQVRFYGCAENGQTINVKITRESVDNITMYCEETGHYYQFVEFSSVKDWVTCYDEASKMTFGGMNGYLATVTSYDEDYFIYKASDGRVGWLGGTTLQLKSTTNYNSLNYNKTCFNTSNTSATQGYWYWACGPEKGTKFYGTTKASSSRNGSGEKVTKTGGGYWYFNWNSESSPGEPNMDENGANCLTTLGFGKGYATVSSLSGLYGWNDIIYNRNIGKSYSGLSSGEKKYTPKGYFVEFGDLTTGSTNTGSSSSITINQDAPKLIHEWSYLVDSSDATSTEKDTSLMHVYCTNTASICKVHGTAAKHDDAIEVSLDIDDYPYNRHECDDAVLSNFEVIKANCSATYTIEYYKADAKGDVSGGTKLSSKPRDVGEYYAKATITGRNVTGSTDDTTTTTVELFKAFSIYRDEANYAEESLNNLQDDEGNLIKKVNGNAASSNLHVVLTDKFDKVTLYRIATVDFNENNSNDKYSDYDDAKWVPEVGNWRAHNLEFSNVKYASPLGMAELNNNKWSEFYQAVFSTVNGAIVEGDYTVNASGDPSHLVLTPYMKGTDDPVECRNITYDAYDDATVGDSIYATYGEIGEGEYTVDFSNLPMGQYAIVATSGSDVPYKVTVVSMVPDHNGAWDSWYIQRDYTVYLKESEPQVDKEMISDGEETDKDTVAIGDIVDFNIDIGLPTLYKDRVVLTNSTTDPKIKPYTLYFRDEMNEALELVVPEGKEATFGYTIEYTYTDGEQKTVELPSDPVTYYELAELGYTPKAGEEAVDVILTAENYSDYAYDKEPNTDLCKGESDSGKVKVIRKSAPMYKIAKSTEGTNTVIRIDFNNNALRAWQKDPLNPTITGIKLTYSAKVTDKAEINSDSNTNKAYLYFEKNGTGTEVGDTGSKTNVYTYGLNLIKVDGNTVDSDKPTPLENAIFWMYKETDTYVKHTTPVEDGDDLVELTWRGDIDGNTEETITPSAEDTTDDRTNTIEAILADNTNYYVLEEKAEAAGETIARSKDDSKQPVTYDSGDTVYRVFRRISVISGNDTVMKDTVTSVADMKGILVKGLNVGNYIMTEYDSPTGYNSLAEDIYFSINKNEDPSTHEPLELKYFKDMEGQLNETGILELVVLNFKGLQLPSTGGMGTLIFTIIGIVVMSMAFVIIFTKRRKKAQFE